MMRSILTVARREIRGLVDQPTAYLLAVAFLVLALYLAFRNMYALGVATLRPLFDLLPTLFAVLVPALTMRSLAEEKRSRTLDWLLAQPLDEWAVVLGKFLGSWTFILIVLAGTLPAGLGLLVVSDADPGIMAAQYLGGALLAAQITAIGIWASATTRNQVTAFILAAALSFALFLIGLPGILQGAPPLVSGILSQLSVLGHFEGVARGVVDLRDVVYFLSATALFLVLAVEAVSEARLAPESKDAKRLQLGTLVVAVIVLVVNLL
jgi:ABC-2 type transport system permease protein